MLLFNLIPIFPLDGYRIISELFDNIYVKEIFVYIGGFILIVILILAFIFSQFGFIIVCIYLMNLNIFKIIEISKQKKLINNQIMYLLYKTNKYC